MLVLPHMPLVVLLLLCLLLLSSDALLIFCLEVAFCVFLCGIRFTHIFWLSFRTAIFKNNVFQNIWPFPVVISGARAAADCIWCLRALRSQSPKTVFATTISYSVSFRKPSWKEKTIFIGQRRLRPLLEPDTSAIEWLLEKSKSFP